MITECSRHQLLLAFADASIIFAGSAAVAAAQVIGSHVDGLEALPGTYDKSDTPGHQASVACLTASFAVSTSRLENWYRVRVFSLQFCSRLRLLVEGPTAL